MIHIDVIPEIPEVLKVYKKSNDQDGFFADLDDCRIVEITRTNYVTKDNWQIWNSYKIYSYASERIAFNENLIIAANDLGSGKCPI